MICETKQWMYFVTSKFWLINSSPPSATYMRQWIGAEAIKLKKKLIKCHGCWWHGSVMRMDEQVLTHWPQGDAAVILKT